MKHSFLSAAVIFLAGISTLSAQELFRHPVVGAITDESATIAVWSTDATPLKIEYALDENFSNATSTDALAPTSANDFAVKATISGLIPASRYYYRVTGSSGTPVTGTFSFKTFPRSGQDAPLTIFFGSCQQGRVTDVGKVFDVAGSMGGDLFVQLGDWGYPDQLISGYPTAPGTIRESYGLRLDTNYSFARRILSRMGIAYIWDDHDFGGNNSNGTMAAPLKGELLAAYDRYLPHYPLANPENGLWHSFMVGNVEFFMIDDRAQRSPEDSALRGNTFNPPPGHSMLAGYPISGVDQRTWLLNAIRSSKARWKVLVSQVFFNPAAGPAIPISLLLGRTDVAEELADKWVGFPADVDSMKALFAAGYGRNFLILSGDAHTNLYDNGTHSIVPEFMAGALDKPNSNLYQQMKRNGLDIWTAGQLDSSSAVGRLRVETTPRHRLILESFDTLGNKLLTLELVDSSASVGVERDIATTWRVTRVEIDGNRSILTIAMEGAPDAGATVMVYSVDGAKIVDTPVRLAGRREITIPIGHSLPAGSYFGHIVTEKEEREFRFNVVK
jgi:alkaline phosphatase D